MIVSGIIYKDGCAVTSAEISTLCEISSLALLSIGFAARVKKERDHSISIDFVSHEVSDLLNNLFDQYGLSASIKAGPLVVRDKKKGRQAIGGLRKRSDK